MSMITKTVGGTGVRMWSEGQGAPLLFLHGFEGPLGDVSFLKRLAQTYKVFAPEHPGFGETGGFADQHDIVDLVLHYRALLESFGGEPVVIVGHCLGGMFAAEIAALCPHLVSKLVLISSYGLWLDDEPLPDPFVLSRAELSAAKWATQDAAARETLELRSVEGDEYRLQNLGAATRFMWPIPDRGLSRRLASVQASTLIVHGEHDVLVPSRYAQAFADRIANSDAALVAKAGHFPMIEQEEALVQKIVTFLQD